MVKKKVASKKRKKKVVSKKSGKPILSEGNYSQASDGCSGNRVFVALAKTINLGNYESIRVEYGQGKVVQKGESFDEIKENLVAECLEALPDIIEQVEEQLS